MAAITRAAEWRTRLLREKKKNSNQQEDGRE
jgi:hypothetical protein